MRTPGTFVRSTIVAFALLGGALILWGPRAAAQQPIPGASPSPSPKPFVPPPTFAVDVTYVEVDAIVTDRSGQPVRDLTRDDFVVKEDGKPQAIELFTQIDIPYERPEPAAPPPVQPDVRNNLRPFEGRLYVIVMDELHTHPARSLLVRAAARRFLERHFAEGDLAAVVHTSGGPQAGQELTGDRRLLLAAVDRFVGRALPSTTLSRIDEYRRTQPMRQQGDPVRDPDEMERGYQARASLDTLRSVAGWLSGIRGRRKAVLFFSEGIDVNLYDQINNREASSVMDALREATAEATRANVSFYTIDPRGLGGLDAEMMEIQPVFDDPSLGLDTQGLEGDLRLSQDSLKVLADETQGQAAVNTNDFSTAFARIVKDNSAYYVLGYYPAGQRKDGRYHKLDVKVTRPGLRVRARNGYSTGHGKGPNPLPVEEASEAVGEMLESPLPRSGLPMAIQAAAFAGEAGKARVMVDLQFAPGAFHFVEKDGQSHEAVELSLMAVDASAKATGSRQTVQLDLKPRTREMVDAAGFRVLTWMDLPPGRYQIRTAGHAANTNASGSVFYDLVVPEFAKQTLGMSGVVLTSSSAGLVPTAGDLALLKEVLPGAPTTARAFRATDTLALMAEIYDGEKTPHTLDVVTTLTAPDGSVAWRNADQRSSEALQKAGPGAAIVHTAQLALKDVPPGPYVLRVSATSRLGKKPPSVERSVPIEVLAGPAPSPAPSPAP